MEILLRETALFAWDDFLLPIEQTSLFSFLVESENL